MRGNDLANVVDMRLHRALLHFADVPLVSEFLFEP